MKRTRKSQWGSTIEVPQPDTVNKEGFAAYTRPLKERVLQALMTGSTANLFYLGKEENIELLLKTLKECKDYEYLAKAIAYARNEGFTRSAPIAGLAVLSTVDREKFMQIAPFVCRNPHDWQNFIDLVRTEKVRQGMGRMLKREVLTALRKMEPYHAIKYPQAVLDMVNIARPNPKLNPAIINYVKKNELDEKAEQFMSLKRLENAETAEEAANLIMTGRLPFEVVTGMLDKWKDEKDRKVIWTALLKVAPHFNLVRNLNTFARHGVFTDPAMVELAFAKLTNKAAIAKAMLFPFRYYVAANNLENVPKRIEVALEEACNISVMNVPEMTGRIVICPDISGSMQSNVTSDESALQCIDLVGVFTGTLVKKCKDIPLILPFNNTVHLEYQKKVMGCETIFEIANLFTPQGGTSLSAPVIHMIEKKIVADKIIAFTDNQEWVGQGFIEAFLRYRQQVNPKCEAYLVTLINYATAPTPKDIEGVYYIYGWNDGVLKILTTNPSEQVKEVENFVFPETKPKETEAQAS